MLLSYCPAPGYIQICHLFNRHHSFHRILYELITCEPDHNSQMSGLDSQSHAWIKQRWPKLLCQLLFSTLKCIFITARERMWMSRCCVRPETVMGTWSLHLKHRKEMSSNDVFAVCHNVLSRCFYTVYIGSCCGSQHLWLYNLLVKMFGRDSLFITMLC